MTIASEITRIKTNIENAYTALEAKGATIPSEKNSANLASTVNTITGGGSSNWLSYVALNNNFELINSPSYSGTEYTFPDGVTSCGITTLMQEMEQKMQEMETEYQSKVAEINNSSLSEEEKEEQLNALEIEYEAIQGNITNSFNFKFYTLTVLYMNRFNHSSIVTFNSNELNDFVPGLLPFKVEYVSLPNVTTAPLGISIAGKSIHIKELSAPALEEISLPNFFEGGSLEKLYLNPQGTWRSCKFMCSGCTNLTEATVPPIPDMRSTNNYLTNLFENCTKLTDTCGIFSGITTIPSFVTDSYGLSYTFSGCTSLTSTGLDNVTSIGSYGLSHTFSGCTSLTSTGLDNVTSIGNRGLYYTFEGCTSLTSTGLNSVTNISDFGLLYAFQDCTSLTSTGLDNLTSIGTKSLNYAFRGCTSLTSTGLNSVTNISDFGLQYAFQDCTNLTTVNLNNVTSIGQYGLQYAFQDCTSLTSLSFPKLNSNSFGSYTNQFDRMLYGVTGCTVHFPSNLESVIGSWSDVTNGFGGTNTTVLFDLPATT